MEISSDYLTERDILAFNFCMSCITVPGAIESLADDPVDGVGGMIELSYIFVDAFVAYAKSIREAKSEMSH